MVSLPEKRKKLAEWRWNLSPMISSATSFQDAPSKLSPDMSAKKPLFLLSTHGQYQNDGSYIIHISSVDDQGTVQKTFTKKVINVVDSLQSCASLVCLAGQNYIYVCNPSTKESVTLPPASPSAINWVGLGYSYSTEQYKVIHLFRSGYDEMDNPQIACEVFTLGCEESSWRRVENCPYPVYLSPPTFVEGSLHWVIDPYYHMPYGKVILSFDLDREEFRVFPHPEFCSTPDSFWPRLHFVELKGCLCVVQATEPLKLSIWMLKDYKNGTWVKEYNLDLLSLGGYDILPRAIRSNGAILMEMPSKRLAYYDPESGTYTQFNTIEAKGGFLFSSYVEGMDSLGSK